ncbi:Phytoene synthase [invertebrate metagenome]|uniref:Phytoene synthase n=1 Tax=invertebrate metagenome TaxID=1711999 RepID=A0A484HC67_9ZZZZ
MLTALAIVSCCIWVWLLLFHQGFWKADQHLETDSGGGESWPAVVVVVPARDEATILDQSLTTVLAQDYQGQFQVILVDDHSNDGTAVTAQAIAKATAKTEGYPILTVIQSAAVPAGWTGKLWALTCGLQQADMLMPEAHYVLLTDADIAYEPWVLRALVRQAEKNKQDLVSVMALLRCASRWERLLIPAFVFFFQKLYPFPAINNPVDSTAGAAGGCMLLRRDTLRRAGDLVLIRDRVIDDCALARLIKAQGSSIWLGLSAAVHSLRSYDSLKGIWTMVTRTAFVQLEYKTLRLVGVLLGMGLIYLAGPAALVVGAITGVWSMSAIGVVVWVLMGVAYRPTLRLYCRPVWESIALPIAACLYTAMTADSALRFWFGHGGQWKGRTVASAATKDQQSMRAVAGRAQTSFFWAMALLRREQREAMFAVYAFCRTVDDIADDLADPAERRAGLNLWREELALLYEGNKPRHPIAVALAGAVRRFNLRYEDCAEIINGVEMDAEGPLQAPSLATLDIYCDRVASAVGRLSVQIFGLPAGSGDRLSHALGRALQLTNILRDLSEDAACGRLYLPRELLEAHGIAHDLPLVEMLRHPALPEVCAALGTIARRYFAAAEQVLAECPRRRVRAAVLMKAAYQTYLARLETSGFCHPEQRIRLSGWEKVSLVIRCMLI